MSAPRFSIATPTRNAVAKLQRCVGSVRGQTGVTFEHLVQDARSTDGSAEWLSSQPDLLAVSEPDRGMYDAINRAWSRSRGEFLSWLNSDEQYLPGTLAAVARYFDAHPRVDVVFGDYIVVDGEGRAVALRREIPFRSFYVANSFLNTLSCTLFFRRRTPGSLRFEDRYRYAADMELMLRLARAGAVIDRIPAYLALFGIDGSNLSTHPAAAAEATEIGRRHGGLRVPALRPVALTLRRIERLFRGGYRAQPIHYRYALDAIPNYAEHGAARLKGRYHLGESGGGSA